MRPSGPLPPRVYWARRLVLLAIVLMVTVLVWWLVSAPGDANETAAPGASTTRTPPSSSSPTTGVRPQRDPVIKHPRRTRHSPTPGATSTAPAAPPSKTPTKKPRPTKTPLADPTGPCTPTGVDMSIDVSDAKAGDSNTATFELTSLDTVACTLAITPSTLVVKVTSGSDTVWSSDDCPDALLAKQIVVRADPASQYEFSWGGERSSDGCQPVDSAVSPGGYWIQAALIGGEPHKAYFDLKQG